MHFGIYGSAGLALVAAVWCSQVARTLPEDLRTFRDSSEPTDRIVQVVIWLISALLALWAVGALIAGARALFTAIG